MFEHPNDYVPKASSTHSVPTQSRPVVQVSPVLAPQDRPHGLVRSPTLMQCSSLFLSPSLQDLTGLVRILPIPDGIFPWSLATGAFSNVFKGEYRKLTTPGRADAGSVSFSSSNDASY
jgi:hypothetical protein